MLRTIRLVSLVLVLVAAAVGCSRSADMRPAAVSVAYLWSLADARSVAIDKDYYVEGRVVLTDKFGEMQRAAVIADATGCLEIKIDSRDVERLLPIDSRVRIRCSGLHVGQEGRKVVLGEPPTDEYTVDRIAEAEIYNYAEVVSTYDVPYDVGTVSLGAVDASYVMHYIELREVWFVRREHAMSWCDRDADGNYIDAVRHLTDGSDTLRVVVRSSANYAGDLLPTGTLRCQGIVEWHNDSVALRIAHRHVVEEG